MRFLLLIAAAALSVGASKPAPKGRPTGEPAACAALHQSYEKTSMDLALSAAENELDKSAIRVTMRASNDANNLAQARITLDLMRSNGCKLPTEAPSAERYIDRARTCVSLGSRSLCEMKTPTIEAIK